MSDSLSPLQLLCAFTTATPLRLAPPRAAATSACVYMKAKRGGAASEKRAAKNKRTSGTGTGKSAGARTGAGFGAGATPKPRAPAATADDTPTGAVAASDDAAPTDVKIESASGAAGDATPHRALVPGPASAQMEDPQEDPLEAPEPPLVELPTLTPEQVVELRLDRRQSLDQLIERFAEARMGGSFAEVVVANRDLVTERLLYRFTSAIFQVENRATDVETREEEARNMRALRKDLIAHCWSHDYAFKVEIQEAEARLLAVLQGSNVRKDVARNCGRSTPEVDAFWVVIFAAVAAWEERGRENPELVKVDMQKALAVAADACQTEDAVATRLSSSLKALQKILASSDPQIQTSVVAELDDATVAEIGSFTEQVRLLPTAAYGALCERMGSILDYILADKYKIPTTGLEPFRFELPPTERGSRLVEFSKRSREMRGNR